MLVRCPKCNRKYEVGFFHLEKIVHCECGEMISRRHHKFLPPEDQDFLKEICRKLKIYEEEKRLRILKTAAERVCSLILHTDYPLVDIEIEKQKIKKLCEELFPEKTRLYEIIYEARFDRLWEQFRQKQ